MVQPIKPPTSAKHCATCRHWHSEPDGKRGRCTAACGWHAYYPPEHSCLAWRAAQTSRVRMSSTGGPVDARNAPRRNDVAPGRADVPIGPHGPEDAQNANTGPSRAGNREESRPQVPEVGGCADTLMSIFGLRRVPERKP